jgi:serine/threonine protein kinase
MIDENGSPVIIDFGCAVPLNASQKKKIFVTPGFSPLEFYSETSRQGRYSDIYSLAATLYYYLTGKAPSDASARIIVDEIEDLRSYNRIISPILSRVIMKNLSLNYRERYTSLKRFRIWVYLEYLLLRMKRVS